MSKLDSIENKVAGLSTQLDRTDTRVISLETKISEIEASRSYDSHVCDELSTKFTELEHSLTYENAENDILSYDRKHLKNEHAKMFENLLEMQAKCFVL